MLMLFTVLHAISGVDVPSPSPSVPALPHDEEQS